MENNEIIDRYFLTPVANQIVESINESFSSETFYGIYIQGLRGSGKTTLLKYLEQDVIRKEHWIVYINAKEADGFEEFISNLSRSFLKLLSNKSFTAESSQTYLFQPFTDVLERRTTSIIDTFIKGINEIQMIIQKGYSLVLIIDDLEFDQDERSYLELIRRLNDLTPNKIKLIIASINQLYNSHFYLNRFISFRLQVFNKEESYEFLEKILSKKLKAKDKQTLINASEGNPLLLTIFAKTLSHITLETSFTEAEGISSIFHKLIDLTINSDRFQDKNIRKVLHSIAAIEGVEFDLLKEIIGIEETQLWSLLDDFVDYGFILPIASRLPNTKIEYSHNSIKEYFSNELYNNFNIKFSDLQFGAEEAERDDQLYSSLVSNPVLNSLLVGNKNIVIGDRGSGKSALFRMLTYNDNPTLTDEVGPKPIVLYELNPSSFIQSLIIKDTNASSAEKFKAIWLSYFAALLAKWHIKDQNIDANLDKDYTRDCKRIIHMVGWSDLIYKQKGLKYKLMKLLRILPVKVSLKIGPVTVEPATGLKHNYGLGSSVDIEQFLRTSATRLSTSNKICKIVIDQIDEIFKYDRINQEALVQGLFLAESHISQLDNLSVIILLRTDLYEVYDIQEKNKFQSRFGTINWSEQDIILALLKRLCVNKSIIDLTEYLGLDKNFQGIHRSAALRVFFPAEVEGQQFEDWLIKGMRNGRNRISPRQIILFLNETRDYLIRRNQPSDLSFPVFSSSAILSALTQLSALSYDEVISDFRIAITFVRNCKSGRIKTIVQADIENLMNLEEGSVVEQVERLEKLGYLSRVVERDEKGDIKYWFKIPDLYTRCW